MTDRAGPLHTISVGTDGPRVAFLHGMFGQGRNWNQVAKALAGVRGVDARCLLVDLPDHGRSPWLPGSFSYLAYAAAVAETLHQVGPSERWTVVGHSLGGKTAMTLALTQPGLVERLCVVDIAPRSYGSLDRFGGYIAEMQRLPLAALTSRADAEARFRESDPGVKAFLLQNLRREGTRWYWAANLEKVAADAALGGRSVIAGFPFGPGEVAPFEGTVLWLNGGDSGYVRQGDEGRMREFFPLVRTVTVKGAGHWVHSDAPEIVLDALRRLLGTSPR